MGIESDFKTFINNLSPDKIKEMETTVGEIAKKLNKNYYNLDADNESNIYIVGSVGRGTSIKGVSDLDIIFDLPSDKYKQYDDYSGNGQSALLQEVKKVLKEKYTNTDISGDGQVVVINFKKYTVELVPGFKQSDDRFKYPDTNNGGSWKYTDPLSEISESNKTANDTDNNFIYIANMLRAWKNKQGFKFGGLLIDTLTYKFLNENDNYKNIDFNDYLDMTKDLFYFLKSLNKEQSYWYALGSNQKVYNCDNGKFITKAKNSHKKIQDLTEESSNLNKELRKIFGSKFPKKQKEENRAFSESHFYKGYSDTEEFIEDIFPVDIKYDLDLDCTITQDGFRPTLLSRLLKDKMYLKKKKHLEFYISKTDFDFTTYDYEIYWKVKNVGKVAKEKNCIRGQVVKTNLKKQIEVTSFIGEHFVECYIVKNGVCVAKGHIDVPISNYEYIMA
ncbi:nucleotide-binding domain-containing protein [Clostridium perfringens]|uniref:nucleotide-binding domain-containing protein n=1 Tax=Clostridium perfringens TaxID=1502 RepID=UPI001A31E25B|nr:nucleotidyltransferase [Clostridium perfringens]